MTGYAESMYLLTTNAQLYTILRPSTRDNKILGQQGIFIKLMEHFFFVTFKSLSWVKVNIFSLHVGFT